MRKIISLLALCALVFHAQASTVQEEEAKFAARAWVSRGGALGARLGATVKRLSKVVCATDDATNAVYVAAMDSGGTLFLSTDTDENPVIAFTAATNDFSTIDRASPLWALLSRSGRTSVATARTASASSSKTAASNAASSASESLWANLVAEGKGLAAADADSSGVKKPLRYVTTLGDVRVAPLVQSKWDQDEVVDKHCYDRFTPDLANGERAVCGCVATAMAQIMRYHEFPKASRPSVSRTCYIDATFYNDAGDRVRATRVLTTQAGVYDWSKMTLVPDFTLTDEEADAIGKLTSDAGISVNMNYDREANGGSGAFSFRVPNGFKEAFGYASADYYTANQVSAVPEAVAKGLFANFDAGYPVLMGISGRSGGHAIVGDGYGYKDGVLYVHLNMGWSGSSDFWYNLPNIDSPDIVFNTFDDLVMNIFPEGADKALLSGRVVDANGQAVAGAAVSIRDSSTQRTVTNATTSATGVYGLLLSPGTYDVCVEASGSPATTLSSVSLARTTRQTTTYRGYIVHNTTNSWLVAYDNVAVVSSLGNSSGNDVTLSVASAQMAVEGETRLYATLDEALDDAKSLYAEGRLATAEIEIVSDIALSKSATVDFPCVLHPAGSAAVTVSRPATASILVSSGGTLTVENVVFGTTASTLFKVAAGGSLHLGANVELGVPSPTVAIETADADGLVLTSALEKGFVLNCSSAQAAGTVFAQASGLTLDEANASAALIENAADSFGEVRGVAEENEAGSLSLVWQEIPVPVASSAGYFVGLDGATNAAARFDRLLEKFQGFQAQGLVAEDAEVVVRAGADLSFGTRVSLAAPLTLRGEKASVAIATIASSAGFDVLQGGSLTLRGITFRDFTGETFLDVQGGDVVLSDGACLDGICGTKMEYGPVLLRSGSLTMQSGSCITNGTSAGPGGGICAMGGALNLEGGTIASCSALRWGGGVYAYLGSEKKAGCAVSMSGDISFADNTVSSSSVREDVWLKGSSLYPMRVTGGLLAEAKSIALVCDENVDGAAFATCEGLSDEVARTSARVFACLEPAQEGANLCGQAKDGVVQWSEVTAELDDDERDLAVVRIVYPDGREAFYEDIDAAFQVAAGDFRAEILVDALAFSEDLVVTGRVVLASSSEGARLQLLRTKGAFVHVQPTGALVLTNLVYAVAPATSSATNSSDNALVFVNGGALTLQDGACLAGLYKDDVFSEGARSASAVAVYNGGTFTMESGAEIRDCANLSVDAVKGVQSGAGGGVLVDAGSTAFFRGGAIRNCRTSSGGAVFVANKSSAYVSGDFTATDNASVLTAKANNVVVADLSTLYLAGDLGASAGVGSSLPSSEYLANDTNVVATVADWTSWDFASLTNSAAKFVQDADARVHGFLVTNATATAYVVWPTAIGEDGAFTVGESVYYAAGDVPELPPLPDPEPTPSAVTNQPTPIAVLALEKLDESLWRLVVTNRVPWCFYRVLSTDDLGAGFVTTGDWVRAEADAPAAWTNDVETAGAALFWKIEGKEGEVGE